MSLEDRFGNDNFDPEWERRLEGLLQQPPVLFNLYRMVILLDLYHADSEDYSTLKRSLKLSDGHLSTHLQALKREKLIEAKKEHLEDRQRTMFRITYTGMSALESLFTNLMQVKGAVRT